MKRIQNRFFLLALVALSMTACNNNDLVSKEEDAITENEDNIQKYLTTNNLSATRDSSGLYYVVKETNPQGLKPGIGDEVSVYYKMYTMDGYVVDSTETSKQKPLVFPFGAGLILPGIERGLSLMRSGESYTVLMPFYLGFGNVNYEGIPAYSAIRVEMTLDKVRTESKQVTDYIESKQYAVSEITPSTLHIIRQNVVTGDTLGRGKQVTVNYSGKLLNGTEFDKGSYSFNTGSGAVIPGFDEGIRRMRKGEKAILVFQSSLGYARRGAQNQQTGAYVILPYAPLVFEVEVAQ
ncbi:FKBP-type peptidyl-prolyl cis-trans isomerase [Arundinibacter roseus]|uniref:Peptidyl-prolyl cis-trans isomerase n=1 Tax=Arundinibacter roseus TaxID=2070510 RepID=A0A4R4K7R2_9BACT|nr:FKBP-type peptidyl-prolyl cis-trans isomerase [Arundinibacter roseus]TDB63618.1 FKBP-type peptidyl-prolyl cis-trans isomerase [Arundinibacter roseus]